MCDGRETSTSFVVTIMMMPKSRVGTCDLAHPRNENTFRGGYRAKHRSNYFCSALETGANVDNIVPTNRRVMTPDDSPANSNNPFSSSFNPFPFFFSFQERISQLVDLVVF